MPLTRGQNILQASNMKWNIEIPRQLLLDVFTVFRMYHFEQRLMQNV